jgi:hypothetical protein
MITDEKAIRAAVEYLMGLPSEYLGEPKNVELEGIERHNGEWSIVLSYLAERGEPFANSESPLSQALRYSRRFKEFAVDAETGTVKSMAMPRPRP